MNSVAPSHSQAIACFTSLRSIGVSAPVARAIARQYDRPSVLPVRRSAHMGTYDRLTMRPGLMGGLS